MNYTRHVEYSDRSEQVLHFGKMEFGFELELELALRTDIDKDLCWLCCMHGIGRVDIRRSTLDTRLTGDVGHLILSRFPCVVNLYNVSSF